MFSSLLSKTRTNGLAFLFIALSCALVLSIIRIPTTSATECDGQCTTGSGSEVTGSGSTGSGSEVTGSGSTPTPTPQGGVVFIFPGNNRGIGGPSFTPTPSPQPSPTTSPTPATSPNPDSASTPEGGSDENGSPAVTGATCPYLTAFMKYGRDNDPEQVRLLQRFLRDYEKADVSETGIFDQATLSAVHAFQQKYATDILSPWGISRSTGIVSITTRKKINEIVCHEVRDLSSDERAEIQRIIRALSHFSL